ncbi:MAG: hypothetical protein V4501_01520 [Pseudomonadota bacterium]
MKKLRRRYYRDHKYVIDMLIDCQQTISRTNFRDHEQTQTAINMFTNIVALVECHAEHEHKSILELLRKKGSNVEKKIEEDHAKQHQLFIKLIADLDKLQFSKVAEDRLIMGYQFYLNYMRFFGDSLKHMHAEETVIMPELQRLYTDAELAAIEINTYSIMTPQEMLHMIKALFPHIDANDREAFVADINHAEPAKLQKIWKSISNLISAEESDYLINKYNITISDELLIEDKEIYYAWEQKPNTDAELVLTQHQRDNNDYKNTLEEIFKDSKVAQVNH